jgi:mannosyltransferase OCH1-like enzyme
MNNNLILIILIIVLLFLTQIKSSFAVYSQITLLDYSNESNKSKSIPKVLMQTYKDKSKVPGYIFDNIKKYSRDYEYYFFDDTTVITFFKNYFIKEVYDFFNTIDYGAFKADLFRYCWLYINGGVYLDIKTIQIKNLNEIIDHSVQDTKHQIYSVNSIEKGTIYQGILASTPKNPLFLDAIKKMMNMEDINRTLGEDYALITRQLYEILQTYKESQIIKLFQEKCDNNYKDKSKIDKYGKYCTVLDNNKLLFETRDPKYPY